MCFIYTMIIDVAIHATVPMTNQIQTPEPWVFASPHDKPTSKTAFTFHSVFVLVNVFL